MDVSAANLPTAAAAAATGKWMSAANRPAGPGGQLDDPAANRGRASPRPLRFAANLPTAAAAAATGVCYSAANLQRVFSILLPTADEGARSVINILMR
jgi:hypothetical protein